MPKHMGFTLTTKQFLNKTKTVTIRLGWWSLKPGDIIWGCRKCMGIKKGGRIERFRLIMIVSVSSVPLKTISKEDVVKEGYPNWSKKQFIKFFCNSHNVSGTTIVNRIEFKHLGA